MKTITLPNDKLRKRSQEVALPLSTEDKQIADDLIKYIELSKDPRSGLRPGIGLAAVQLGHLKRMFYVDFQNGKSDFKELLINPVIIEEGRDFAALEGGEGCLSVKEEHPNQEGLVHRKNSIIIRGFSYLNNQEVGYKLEGFPAIVFQHEYDHLEGKLFIDHINKKRPWEPKAKEIII